MIVIGDNDWRGQWPLFDSSAFKSEKEDEICLFKILGCVT